MRKIFLPPELYTGIQDLDFTTKGILFDLIYRYNLGLDYEIDEKVKVAFGFFRHFFDKDIENYKTYKEIKKENGKMGGRPKKLGAYSENSQKPKKPKKPIDIDIDIDIYIDNNNIYKNNNILYNNLKEYIKNRKEIKKPIKTIRALELIIKELNKYDDDTKIKMLERSIMNNRIGVFPLTGSKPLVDYTKIEEFHNGMANSREKEIKVFFENKYGETWRNEYSKKKQEWQQSDFYLKL